ILLYPPPSFSTNPPPVVVAAAAGITSSDPSATPIEYYHLSHDDRAAHQYSINVAAEQAALAKAPRASPPTYGARSELTRMTLVRCCGGGGVRSTDETSSHNHQVPHSVSGITADTLAGRVDVTLGDVQQMLLTSFLYDNTALVGHSIDSDLRLVHPHLAYTALLYPHPREFLFKPSFKMLAATYLHQSIQSALPALRLF
ncbi:hypothetical protein DYB34_014348, partial [Aphanomyces astaci]